MLFRVPLVGGRLDFAQLAQLAAMAEGHGNGIIELTNRGNLQLRGVAESSVGVVVDALSMAGLGNEMARLVTISPMAGRREHVARDGIVEAVADIDLDGLTGKFAVHVDDGAGCTGRHADVVVTCNSDGSVAIDLGSGVVEMSIASAGVALRRVMTSCIEQGPNARWKDVAGVAETRSLDIQSVEHASPVPGTASTTDGDAVLAGVTLGRTTPTQLRAVARVATSHGLAACSITPWRSILFATPSSGPDRLISDLEEIGLITSVDHPAHGVIACVGGSGCWQTELDTLSAAGAVIAGRAQSWDATTPSPSTSRSPSPTRSPVHVSGCAKSCASQQPFTVLFLGRDDSSGFDMVVAQEVPA